MARKSGLLELAVGLICAGAGWYWFIDQGHDPLELFGIDRHAVTTEMPAYSPPKSQATPADTVVVDSTVVKETQPQ